MTIDPNTGLQLKQVYDFISNWLDQNAEGIKAAADMIDEMYQVPEPWLEDIESRVGQGLPLSADDMKILARATGDDFMLSTCKEVPQEMNDKVARHINNLFNIRKAYRPKEDMNAGK